MSEQDDTPAISGITTLDTAERNIDKLIEDWHKRSQGWRTDPEISIERQKYLTNCIQSLLPERPDLYPFLYEKLTRADVEWLIANSLRDRGKLLEQVKKLLTNKEA